MKTAFGRVYSSKMVVCRTFRLCKNDAATKRSTTYSFVRGSHFQGRGAFGSGQLSKERRDIVVLEGCQLLETMVLELGITEIGLRLMSYLVFHLFCVFFGYCHIYGGVWSNNYRERGYIHLFSGR